MTTSTPRLKTVWSFLREFGIAVPVGARQVIPHISTLVSELPSWSRKGCGDPHRGQEQSRLSAPLPRRVQRLSVERQVRPVRLLQ